MFIILYKIWPIFKEFFNINIFFKKIYKKDIFFKMIIILKSLNQIIKRSKNYN